MGRKTNSVSLRLKKTNRDYNNCWYGDILYADNFSKSLKVGNYLSQTLKTIGMPCSQASVIGAFKKASLLVCYLDPKKRKRLLEKSSKGLGRGTPAEGAYQSKQSENKTKAFFSLGQIKQNSKALLKPLEAIFDTSFGSLSLQHSSKQHLVATPFFALGPLCKKGIATHERPPRVTNPNSFTVKNIKHKVNDGLSKKKITKPFNYIYRGSLGLEFNQSKGSYARVFGVLGVQKKNHQVNNKKLSSLGSSACSVERSTLYTESQSKQSKFEPLLGFSNINLKTCTSFSLKGAFFVKKKKALSFSDPLQLLPLEDYKGIRQKGSKNRTLVENNLSKNTILFTEPRGDLSFLQEIEKADQRSFASLQFFPFIFENTVFTQKEKPRYIFKFFSDFFYSDKKHLPLICAFNKNLTIFGKKPDLCYTVFTSSFSCLSEYVLNTRSCTDYIKNYHVDKEQLCQKRENCSLTNLYGFYKGFSHFWENVVSLSLYKSTNETSCALFLADTVSYLLERKILFRSIKRQLLLELNQSKYAFSVQEFPKLWGFPSTRAFENKKKVTGIRISCSGRVGGRSKKAQRSRKDTFMWGETGLHVFSSKLDFAKTHAETPFGVVGVQVWVCTK